MNGKYLALMSKIRGATSMKSIVCGSLIGLLSACGGGGSGGTGGGQGENTFPNSSIYTGTWISDCSFHTRTTAAFVYATNGVLQATSRDDAYANADCTGPILATITGATPTVTYASTVGALVQLSPTGSASNIAVDKVTIATGQYQQVVIGATAFDTVESGVQKRCVPYSASNTGSRTCWPSGVQAASSHVGGLYVSGNTLYTMSLASNGIFSVDGVLRRP